MTTSRGVAHNLSWVLNPGAFCVSAICWLFDLQIAPGIPFQEFPMFAQKLVGKYASPFEGGLGWSMIKHFKSNEAIKASMNSRSCYMDTKTKTS